MNKRFILNFLLIVCFMAYHISKTEAQVSVTLTADESFSNQTILNRMADNLSKVLSEINNAQKEKRGLKTTALPINQFASESLSMLWSNVHFYCDDSEVVERCWVFGDGKEYMVSHIPLIIEVDGGNGYGNGTYQEAVVEFDAQGRITDFRFSLNAQMGESMENCGSVVSMEIRMKILSYLERFRTAYNTKDIDFLQKVYSDDALIITGKVIQAKPAEGQYTQKVVYNKQNKQQYLTNLKRVFARNNWIDVAFREIGDNAELGSCAGITQSKVNKNMYGVRLIQEWKSESYEDTGYLFLLWDFENEQQPVIHVRTWQPSFVKDDKGKKTEIPASQFKHSTLKEFDL